MSDLWEQEKVKRLKVTAGFNDQQTKKMVIKPNGGKRQSESFEGSRGVGGEKTNLSYSRRQTRHANPNGGEEGTAKTGRNFEREGSSVF